MATMNVHNTFAMLRSMGTSFSFTNLLLYASLIHLVYIQVFEGLNERRRWGFLCLSVLKQWARDMPKNIKVCNIFTWLLVNPLGRRKPRGLAPHPLPMFTTCTHIACLEVTLAYDKRFSMPLLFTRGKPRIAQTMPFIRMQCQQQKGMSWMPSVPTPQMTTVTSSTMPGKWMLTLFLLEQKL